MKKHTVILSMLAVLCFALCGCQSAGSKSTDLSVIYLITAVISLIALGFYCFTSKKKDPWFLLLFVCVLVVNIGYLSLSLSHNLEEALLANRLAYLGSVFLPISMWMIILGVTNTKYARFFPAVLIAVGVLVFLVAASPGYLDIYYKEVSFEKVNGVAVLNKVYGPLHALYLVYLLSCFAAMVAAIVRATLKETVESPAYAAILAVAVFVNIGVWMIEQMVRIDFEILSVSYIISEVFLLGLKMFMAEIEKQRSIPLPASDPVQTETEPAPELVDTVTEISVQKDNEDTEAFIRGRTLLTPKERSIYDCYVSGATTSEILLKLCITENTLKFHNKNLYGKLGVSSRKQLIEKHNSLKQQSSVQN